MSYYEINVVKRMPDGTSKHFFATADRSIRSREEAREVYGTLRSALPEDQYGITVAYCETSLKTLQFEPEPVAVGVDDGCRSCGGFNCDCTGTGCD